MDAFKTLFAHFTSLFVLTIKTGPAPSGYGQDINGWSPASQHPGITTLAANIRVKSRATNTVIRANIRGLKRFPNMDTGEE